MRHQKRAKTAVDQFDAETSRLTSLTPRERQVSVLVAEGLTNKQIGQRLFISSTTVRHHLTSVFNKLDINSRFELIVICYRHKIVVPPVVDLAQPQGEHTRVVDKVRASKKSQSAARK